MYQLCEKSEFIQWFVSVIKGYHKPNQLGVIGSFVNWLSVTKDLPLLCHLACLNPNGPQFNPVEFADGLASTWISVKSDAEGGGEEAPETVESQLSSILLDMQGFKGRNMRFHMDEEDVISILTQYFPQDAQEMEKVFFKETEKLQAQLEEMTELALKKESAQNKEDPERGDGMSFVRKDFTIEHFSPEQQKMLNWIGDSVGRIRKEMEETPEFLPKSTAELKKTLSDQFYKVKVMLAEGCWNWIEQEEDKELLKVIVVLLYIDSQGLTFCNLRRAILENRELCQAVLELSRAKDLPDQPG
jgi:hypothetical protein